MNIQPILNKHKFRTFNIHGLVTDVREYIDDNGYHSLVLELIHTVPQFSSNIEARIWVKKLIVELYNQQFIVNQQDIPTLIDQCWEYTNNFLSDIQWSFLQVQPEKEDNFGTKPVILEQKQVVEGIEVKVEVKADGKIKKGGKQVVAYEMYLKYVIGEGMKNKDFVQKLQDELGMTKAGANTYSYNMKKKYEEEQQ